jgi:hypothetical protein
LCLGRATVKTKTDLGILRPNAQGLHNTMGW